MMDFLAEYGALFLIAVDWCIRLVLGVRVVMRRGTVGFTLAWLAVILLLPVFGAVIYLLLGERRLGTRRARRIAELRAPYEDWLDGLHDAFPLPEEDLGDAARALRRQARSLSGIPGLPGNRIELITTATTLFDSLLDDIRNAKSSIHLEFYIWTPGGRVDDVADALKVAASSGVKVRVLVDAVGGMDLWDDDSYDEMREAGVQIHSMLPVGPIRSIFARIDLRNHRKIAVIDGLVAYTGSQNMADPRLFKQRVGVGEWIDAMARIRGPAVEAFQITFLADWEFETFEGVEKRPDQYDIVRGEPTGNAMVQVVPSGPGMWQSTIQDLILTAIYGANDELILTTPYFIPDDAMIKAIVSAAARGVDVTLVVPRRPDGRLVKLANEAYFEQMLEAGVRIMRFGDGLLHTKAITIDGETAMFGTANLDMRSFYLNYELTLILYGEESTLPLRELQQEYIDVSEPLALDVWMQRPVLLKFLQQAAQLTSPLL